MKKRIMIITLLISSLFFLMSTFYIQTASARQHSRHHVQRHYIKHHKRHRVRHARHHKKYRRVHVVVKEETLPHQWDVNPHVWDLALKAYRNALRNGYIKQQVVTIIDYSLPSSKKRLWVVDLNHHKILFNTLVTHGKGSGGFFARHFSDHPGSHASSIGTFITENTYRGSNGYSLKLRGLEPGFNDKAKSRAIVIHGAWYASQAFASSHGRLGLSWGCPAVSPYVIKPLINQIKNGSLVFAYYPDPNWLKRSRFLT